MSDARTLAVVLPLIVAWLAIGAGVARRYARPLFVSDDNELMIGALFILASLLWPIVLAVHGLHALGTWAMTTSRWDNR